MIAVVVGWVISVLKAVILMGREGGLAYAAAPENVSATYAAVVSPDVVVIVR